MSARKFYDKINKMAAILDLSGHIGNLKVQIWVFFFFFCLKMLIWVLTWNYKKN